MNGQGQVRKAVEIKLIAVFFIGGSLIRMLNYILDDSQFQKSLNLYLTDK